MLCCQRASADIVCISDLTKGAPRVKVFSGGTCDSGVTDITSSTLTLKPDSGAELLHFTLAVGANNRLSGLKFVTDLWEDHINGTLSDVLLLAVVNPIDVVFCSNPIFCNPAGYTLVTGGLLEPVENGRFQYEGSIGNTGTGTGNYTFYVRSDLETPEPMPEPGSVLLLATSIAAMYFLTRRCCGKHFSC